jgi:CheY-like chemotaxis protein
MPEMRTPDSAPKPVVLSVEDDDAAFSLIRSAFYELRLDFDLLRVEDGEQALAFLNQSDKYRDAPRPSLVLLNMNLPRVSGPEVLAAMQASDVLRGIPAVVFCSSTLDADRARCLALGARDFIEKPTTYAAFVEAVRSACGYVKTKRHAQSA